MITSKWSGFKLFTIANILALTLGACTFQPPTGDNANRPGNQTGCPTPTAVAGISVGEQESEQASVSPAGMEEPTEAITPTDQLSPAEREAILDRVNQGPARPGQTDEAVPPAPGTESRPGDASPSDLDVAPTPTPCR